MSFILRCLREPLVHFTVLGGLVFLAFAAFSDPANKPRSKAQVDVSIVEAERLVDRFRAIWRRPPSKTELDALLDQYIREEMLVREAISLSLDEDDAVIRQRLAQKMDFLIASASTAQPVSDEELKDFMAQNQASYRTEARLAFEQVFIGAQAQAAAVEEISNALDAGADPAQLGEPTLQPRRMPLSGEAAIDGSFGVGFYTALRDQDVGKWVLPVRSGFGLHAVRVTERLDGSNPGLEDVRERLEADWRAAQAEQLKEEYIERLGKRFSVTRPDDAALRELLE